jgi:hypothetical protein
MIKKELEWPVYLAGFLLVDSLIVLLSICFPAAENMPYQRFLEKQWVTLFSLLKLTAAATICFMCYVIIRVQGGHRHDLFWLIAGCGLAYIGLDDWFYVRERTIESMMGHGFEKLSSLVYLAVACGVLIRYWGYLKRLKSVRPYFAAGAGFFALKILTGVLHLGLGDTVAYVMGGVLKLYGESFFIIAFIISLIRSIAINEGAGSASS